MRLSQLNSMEVDAILDNFDFPKDEVISVRQNALKEFKNIGLPTAKHEQFGKTGIRTIYDVDYVKEYEVGNAYELEATKNYRIVFRKGFYSPLQSILPDGVRVRFDKEPKKHTHKQNTFYYLSMGLNENFYSITVEEGLQVEKPIEIVYLDERHASQSHMHIRAEIGKGAKVDIFERVLIDSASFLNHTLQVDVCENAQVVHVREQNAQEHTHIISNYAYTQDADSSVQIFAYEKGSDLSIGIWDISLAGEKADVVFNTLQMPQNEQRLSTLVNIHHDAPNATSDQLIKQIINDSAKGVVDAKVIVSENGQGTKADQLCNSLILSEQAQVQSFVKPQLEIFIDELEASHGATVGSLDEEQLYYLQSRGISYDSARQLLIDAFKQHVFERFPSWAKEKLG